MTDLTEQWVKGELELDKNYYIKLEDGTIEIQMFVGGFLCKEDNGVKEVLSPVPSYEEWEQLKEELKDYEYQHKQDGICYDDIFCKLELARKENTKLKTDCRTLAQKLIQVKPELRERLEVNFKEYL